MRLQGVPACLRRWRITTSDQRGAHISPTVFADVADIGVIARDEIFGPVIFALPFDDEAEVVRWANTTEYGLSAGVFTRDLARVHRVVAALQAGTCRINAYNLTPVEMSFAGMNASGVGRESCHAAVEHHTQIKSVHVRMGDVDAQN